MDRLTALEILSQARIIAIIRLADLGQARELTEALLLGGIRAIEFTLTNRESPTVISRLRQQLSAFDSGRAMLGIGSVRSVDDAQRSIDAGAQFIVAPTTSLPVIDRCKQQQVCVLPGAYTPTEIVTAWEAGGDLIKVFPARQLGPSYVRDVLAPLPDLRLVPTGGIDLNNLAEYLSAGAAAVGIGGQLLDAKALQAGDWSAITAMAQRYVERAAAGPA
jgi:2-dehydro-3-deoxyphosphogluconate aldolase/(4S)-4-hydroxy-2-oxoglutarate aldolase